MTQFRSSLAAVIGINQYVNGLPPLNSAVADARRVAELLRDRHGYEVILLDSGVTRDALMEVLTDVIPGKVEPDVRVLFYFAGHGIALDGDDGPAGYLIPQDAVQGDPNTFLPMQYIQQALDNLSCRHLLVVLDCCFAGCMRWSSTRHLCSRPATLYRQRYDRYLKGRAWQAIASASHRQEALDVLAGPTAGDRGTSEGHSPFAAALIEGLKGKADLYPPATDGKHAGDGVVTVTELFAYLREKVAASAEALTRFQTPVFWPLKNHEDGEFIFLCPGKTPTLEDAPNLTAENNPYRGLEPYDTEHKDLFAGRAAVTGKLVQQIDTCPFTVVTGASGTGKSSLVRAGLIPELESRGWKVPRPIRPGKSPFAALTAWATAAGLRNENDTLGEAGGRLVGWCREWTAANPTGRLAVIIDQFEELVTQCLDTTDRTPFLAAIAGLATERSDRFRVVLTVRTDFEGQFRDTPLGPMWRAARFPVLPLTQDDLREVITAPTTHRAIFFDPPGLIEKLINDVVQMPGGLPLLSFTMSEMYLSYLKRSGDDRCLTWGDYEAVGGVVVSLRNRVERLYNEELAGGPEQETLKRVMLRMVSVEGGTAARRRVPLHELVYELEEENWCVAVVLEKLTAARLVVTDQDADGQTVVEPAHDALVNGWDRLLRWTRENQEQLVLRRLLTPAANDWPGHGGLWWANPRLAVVLRVSRSAESWLNKQEQAFVLESNNKRQRIYKYVATVITAAFLLLAGLTIFAFNERKQAKTNENTSVEKAHVAESRRLALLSESTGPSQLPLKLLLALEACSESDTRDAVLSLQHALETRPYVKRYFEQGHQGSIRDIAMDAGGRITALFQRRNNRDGCVVVYDANGKELPNEKWALSEGSIDHVACADDGRLAVAYYNQDSTPPNGVIVLSGGRTDLRQTLWPVSEGKVKCLAFGIDGALAVGYSRDSGNVNLGGVTLLDKDGRKLSETSIEEGEVRALVITKDGRIAAGFTKQEKQGLYNVLDCGVAILPAKSGEKTIFSLEDRLDINCIAISPDGSLAVGGGVALDDGGGMVTIFQAGNSSSEKIHVKLPAGKVSCLSYAKDGRLAVGLNIDADTAQLAIVKKDGTIDSSNGFQILEGRLTRIVFTPDERLLASYEELSSRRADEDDFGDGVIIFDAANNRLASQSFALPEGMPRQLVFGPDGTLAAEFWKYEDSQVFDSGVVIFKKDGNKLLNTSFSSKEGRCTTFDFTDDGRLVIGLESFQMGAIAVWNDVTKDDKPIITPVPEGFVRSVAVAHNGTIAAAFQDPKYEKNGVIVFESPFPTGRRRVVPLRPSEWLAPIICTDDNNILAVNRVRNQVMILRDNSSEPESVFSFEGELQDASFHHNGRLALGVFREGAGRRGGISVHNVRNGNEAPGFCPVPFGAFLKVACDADGRVVAGTVGLDRIYSTMVFAPDNTNTFTSRMADMRGGIRCVAIASDGRIAVGTSSGDGQPGHVLVYDLDLKVWKRHAAATANRNLTHREWTRCFSGTPYRRTIRACPWPPDLPEGSEVRKAAEFEESAKNRNLER